MLERANKLQTQDADGISGLVAGVSTRDGGHAVMSSTDRIPSPLNGWRASEARSQQRRHLLPRHQGTGAAPIDPARPAMLVGEHAAQLPS